MSGNRRPLPAMLWLSDPSCSCVQFGSVPKTAAHADQKSQPSAAALKARITELEKAVAAATQRAERAEAEIARRKAKANAKMQAPRAGALLADARRRGWVR